MQCCVRVSASKSQVLNTTRRWFIHFFPGPACILVAILWSSGLAYCLFCAFCMQVILCPAIRTSRTRHFSSWAHREDSQYRHLRTHRQWQDHPHRAHFVLHWQNQFNPRRAGKGTSVAIFMYLVVSTLLPFGKPIKVNKFVPPLPYVHNSVRLWMP